MKDKDPSITPLLWLTLAICILAAVDSLGDDLEEHNEKVIQAQKWGYNHNDWSKD